MSQPDAKEYARQILHHLAAIGAEVEENKLLLCDLLAEVKRIPVEQVRQHYAEVTRQRTDALYLMSCDEAKIAPPSAAEDVGGEVPPPDQGTNPRM